jgi:uncharacterized protein YndB with AHSA1/START domain
MDVAVEQRVRAPVERVFDAMADARNETEWNSQVTRSDLVGDGPIGRGSRFESVNRGQTYLATITRYDRPGDLEFSVTGRQMDIVASFTFRAEGEGSVVTGTFDFRPRGVMRVLLPLLAGSIRRDMPRQLASFARVVEGSTASTPVPDRSL